MNAYYKIQFVSITLNNSSRHKLVLGCYRFEYSFLFLHRMKRYIEIGFAISTNHRLLDMLVCCRFQSWLSVPGRYGCDDHHGCNDHHVCDDHRLFYDGDGKTECVFDTLLHMKHCSEMNHAKLTIDCLLYLDMDLYCRVPCLLAIPSTDDGRHDKIEYVFYTLPHTKHCILNDHARSTSLTNARVLWNQGMDVCYKIQSCMHRPRNDVGHLNYAHHGTSEHVFLHLPHTRRYIWNDHARLTNLCVHAAHHLLLKQKEHQQNIREQE